MFNKKLKYLFIALCVSNISFADMNPFFNPLKFYSCHLKALNTALANNISSEISQQSNFKSSSNCQYIYGSQFLCSDDIFCLSQVFGMAFISGCFRPNVYEDYPEYTYAYLNCLGLN